MRKIKNILRSGITTFVFIFCNTLSAEPASAKEKFLMYFANDSINGLRISDAYETHNMGLKYLTDEFYIKLDMGLVSPDMHSYRNQYREANRSFGEIILLEVGGTNSSYGDFWLYARIKATDKFGIDNLQDFAHRFLSLQRVNAISDLIRMPKNAWVGVGIRSVIKPHLLALNNIQINSDGFVGSDTTFLKVDFTKQFGGPKLRYDITAGGRLVAYDKIISAPPIRAKERTIIPEISFGISYDMGSYNVFVRDTFSLPSIESDSKLYGVLSAGISYEF